MKRVLIPLLALAALPLFAEEKAKTSEPEKASTTTTTAAPAQPVQDSPLVAASRRANRKGKKPTNVITNETLAKAEGSTAKITTSHSEPKPIVMPEKPRPTPEMIDAEKKAYEKRRIEAAAAEKRKADAARKEKEEKSIRRAEESVGEHMDGDAEDYHGPENPEAPPPPPPVH